MNGEKMENAFKTLIEIIEHSATYATLNFESQNHAYNIPTEIEKLMVKIEKHEQHGNEIIHHRIKVLKPTK